MLSLLRVLGTILLSASIVSGQEVNGVALDETAAPVANLSVVLVSNSRSKSYATSTSDKGMFHFTDVQPGIYIIAPASSSAYILDRRIQSAQDPDLVRAFTVIVESEKTISSVALRVVKSAVVSGQIVDRNGDPASDVVVSIVRQGRREGPVAISGGSAFADDRGMFRIWGLLPGTYYLDAQRLNGPGRARTNTVSQSEAVVLTYYPGVADLSRAKTINLTAGEEYRNVKFQMATAHVAAIRGRTIDSEGRPVQGAKIYPLPLLKENDLSIGLRGGEGTSSADGSFEIPNRIPGTYKLLAIKGGLAGGDSPFSTSPVVTPVEQHLYLGTAEVSVGSSDVENVTITILSPRTITGTVTMPGGRYQGKLERPIIVRLISKENFALWPDFIAKADANGSFVLNNVYATSFNIKVEGLPVGTYVESIRFGERKIASASLDLSNGESGELQITVRSGAGSVQGKVTDASGNGLAGVQVLLWTARKPEEQDETGQRVWFVRSDSTGKFSMEGLPAGAVVNVAAWELAEPTLLENPSFLSHFERDAVQVTVNESSSLGKDDEGITLQPIPLRRIEAASRDHE